jgi:hypothetical protein
MLANPLSRIRRWSMDHFLAVELESIAGRYFDAATHERLIQLETRHLHAVIPVDTAGDVHGWELIINFHSAGYYDPGRTYGPPENCYPPEGDDERTFVSAYILRTGPSGEPPARFEIPHKIQSAMFYKYENAIYAVELPADDPND